MAMKVSVSFKEDEKRMYDFLKKQLSPSIYIKEMLKKEMETDCKKTSADNKSTHELFNF